MRPTRFVHGVAICALIGCGGGTSGTGPAARAARSRAARAERRAPPERLVSPERRAPPERSAPRERPERPGPPVPRERRVPQERPAVVAAAERGGGAGARRRNGAAVPAAAVEAPAAVRLGVVDRRARPARAARPAPEAPRRRASAASPPTRRRARRSIRPFAGGTTGASRSSGGNTGIEFVPMVWGSSTVNGTIPAGSKYLLGFNEPNFKVQSNLTPQAAATAWPALQTNARNAGALIVGPALNFCGPAANCNGTDPYVYLTDFLTACTNCQVDHIAVHWYDDFPSLRAYIESNASLAGWEQFGKPIWLTEFSLNGNATAAQQEAFMRAGHPVPRRPPERLPLLVVQRRPDPQRQADQQRRLAHRPRSGLHQPRIELPVAPPTRRRPCCGISQADGVELVFVRGRGRRRWRAARG